MFLASSLGNRFVDLEQGPAVGRELYSGEPFGIWIVNPQPSVSPSVRYNGSGRIYDVLECRSVFRRRQGVLRQILAG